MEKHDCIIGLIRMSYAEEPKLITEKELIDYIFSFLSEDEETRKFRRVISLPKPFDIQDYRNKRKKTNLKRFNYCPFCSKKIDWKMLGVGK